MLDITVSKFKEDYVKLFETVFAYNYEEGTQREQFLALGYLVKQYYTKQWRETIEDYKETEQKQVFYFSMEFLPGRMLKNNLWNMGILSTVEQALKELNLDLEYLAKGEVDPALGNGGLGRLASCFMDSIASTDLPGHGNGIRYQYGLFKQKFIDGYQVELPENCLRNGNVWEIRKENKAVIVRFGGHVVMEEDESGNISTRYENTQNILAVPYDVGQVGSRNGTINNLRLWSAEIPYGEEYLFRTEEERDGVKDLLG